MGMYLMRQIGTRGVYAHPVLPDFMVFLNWPELPVYWYGFQSFAYAALMVVLLGEIGVAAETGPEMRIQALFRDHFIGAVRAGHPLSQGSVTPERFAAGRHISVSRRGRERGPIDEALDRLGLQRKVVSMVSGFSAALAMARASDLIQEGVTTMEFAGAAEDIARIVHGHPTLSEVVREAALALDKRSLNS